MRIKNQKPYRFLLILTIFIAGLNSNLLAEPHSSKLKVLHLTFHQGCADSVNAIAQELDFDLQTWIIPHLPDEFFDGTPSLNSLYNIDHERAERIWNLHKEEFEKFDVIFTSDTAPLARIFLQNGWEKPLIIWVCDRFDYCDGPPTASFPDQEFYALFNDIANQSNVTVVANTDFEHIYAQSKGVDLGSLVIKPFLQVKTEQPPYNIKEMFYLPAYHNETKFMKLSEFFTFLNIPNFGGRHSGLDDLKTYKGIVHLPYAWSTIALFDNISIGMSYFIPSKKLMKTFMTSKGSYWHQNRDFLVHKKLWKVSEWYNEENIEIFIYFNSWKDLQNKIKAFDCLDHRKKVLAFAKNHQTNMVQRWKIVFEKYQAKESSL